MGTCHGLNLKTTSSIPQGQSALCGAQADHESAVGVWISMAAGSARVFSGVAAPPERCRAERPENGSAAGPGTAAPTPSPPPFTNA